MKYFYVLLVPLVLCITIGHGKSDSAEVSALRGINRFAVRVHVSPELFDIVPTTNQLQSDVELKLRLAGITVNKEGVLLSVEVRGYVLQEINTALFNIDITVRQWARLAHNQELTDCTTWQIISLGNNATSGAKEKIRQTVKDNIDVLINDYLSVNPKSK